MSKETKDALDQLAGSVLHDIVKGAARHCLDGSAPGISPEIRLAIADRIARRSVAAIRIVMGARP